MMWDVVAASVLKVIDKVIPDPEAKARAAMELAQLRQAGEFKEIDAALESARMQTEVNKAEAASGNPFASSWRPSVGYVCAAGLFYASILEPLIRVLAPILGYTGNLPAVDTAITMQILVGLLGLGGMRSAEKIKRAA